MKTFIRKWKSFRSRNEGAVTRKLISEFAGRLYKRKNFRNIVSAFYSPREPDKWIFIVGCYNSGTSILREIIGAHPSVCSLPFEGVTFTDVFKSPEDKGWTRNWVRCKEYISLGSEIDDKAKNQLLKDWAPFWKKNCSIYLEKSISNIERIPWIEANLKNVHFISIVRNGYASCEGMLRKAAPKPPAIREYGKEKYDATFVAQQWEMANVNMKEYLKSVERKLELKYENFVKDPVVHLDRIFSFLNIENRDYSYNPGNNEVLIGGRKFQLKNMNQRSFDRLAQSQIEEINGEIGDSLSAHAYDLISKHNE